jgi:hypothetical protein
MAISFSRHQKDHYQTKKHQGLQLFIHPKGRRNWYKGTPELANLKTQWKMMRSRLCFHNVQRRCTSKYNFLYFKLNAASSTVYLPYFYYSKLNSIILAFTLKRKSSMWETIMTHIQYNLILPQQARQKKKKKTCAPNYCKLHWHIKSHGIR